MLNPPAFPVASAHSYENGMTLRDWFAGQALAGLSSNSEIIALLQRIAKASGGDCHDDLMARMAGEYADAMMKNRLTTS